MPASPIVPKTAFQTLIQTPAVDSLQPVRPVVTVAC